MAKFCGIIGFITKAEKVKGSGIYDDIVVEKKYYGDTLRNYAQMNPAEYVSTSITFNNDISILAGPYAVNHFTDMRYIIIANKKWVIKSVEIKPPRLVLKIGGLYNAIK